MASKTKRGEPRGPRRTVPRASPSVSARARQATSASLARPQAKAAAVRTEAVRAPLMAIVVIGASAGGLEAFRQFFEHMPADSGMAFVLVPHLDPGHQSMMVELLSRHTPMPVREAAHRMALEPNHVYVIPPNKYLAVEKGRLALSPPPRGGSLSTAIDFALASLARDRKERAIGVVLSGSGTHGTSGLKEIKLAGGVVMVQDPATAEFDQMPRSVLASGLAVDYVLAPEKMPAALLAYSRHAQATRQHQLETPDATMLDGMKHVLALLLARTRCDFRAYRKSMVMRRIQRRMALLHIADIRAYIERLRADPAELSALRKDLWIGVTAFFREPDAFDVLSKEVLPRLIERATPELPVRVWVPACATGEEAYTLAILLFEQFRAAGKAPSVQIFATDIDEDSMKIARQGVYSDSVVGALSPERLKSFFGRRDAHHYQVSKPLRECIVFAPQNLITDPPFLRIDLVSCRNILIYLEPETQAEIIARLHFALNEGGCLLLGPAESLGQAAGLFEPVSKKSRVFRRIGPARRERAGGALARAAVPELHPPHRERNARPALAPGELMQRVLLKEFVPAAVLVDGRFEILAVQGPVVNYLEFPPGKITRGLMSLCREGLRAKLRTACRKAEREGRPVHDPDAHVRRDGDYFRCTITVRPIAEPRQRQGLLLVVFQDLPETFRPEGARRRHAERESAAIRRLEEELQATREDLQATIQELEGANEELRGSNEEVVSMNEELQSTNQELESSKEELQSLNEELTTVNSQLEEKVRELDAANGDMDSLMAATDLAIVFLDRDLRIKRFTTPTTHLLHLIESDIGRPFRDIAPRFADGDILRDARRVVETLSPLEKEIRTEDNRWYLLRILPYRSGEDRIGGTVVTFIDITRRVEMETRVRHFAAVLENSDDAIAVRDFEGRITAWNRGAEKMYGYSQEEALKLNIRDLVPAEFLEHSLDITKRVARGEIVPSFETRRRARDGHVIDVWATVTLLRDAAGKPESFATTERDITARRQAEEAVRGLNVRLEQRVAERTAELMRSEEQIRAILDATADGVVTVDTRGRIVTFNKAAERIFGRTAGEAIGQNVAILMSPQERSEHDGYLARYRESGAPRVLGTMREVMAARKDGTIFPVQLSVNEVKHHGLYVGFVRDMTEYKALQKEILDIAVLEQRRIGQELHDDTQQELTGLGLLAQNLSDELGHAGRSAASELAARLAEGIAQANLHVRSLARGMVPIPVGKDGLMLALADLARSTEETSGLSCRFECPEPVAVDNDTTATHLYRIAQEAIGNAVKHGKAKALRIELGRADGQLVLEIQDDGIGIEPRSVPGAGVGLRLMGHRCALIGGTLKVQPWKDGGTRVICAVPQGRHA